MANHRAQRASAADAVRGLFSLVFLTAALAGIPIVMLWATHVLHLLQRPVGSHTSLWQTLVNAATQRGDGTVFLNVIALACWAAWALFVLCVLRAVASEIRTLTARAPAPRQEAIRRRPAAVHHAAVAAPAPAAVARPALAASDLLPRQLIASIVLLFSIPFSVFASTAAASASQVPTGHTITATASQQQSHPAAPGVTTTHRQASAATSSQVSPHQEHSAAPIPAGHRSYVVQPGDSLWEIAQTMYGNGNLYPAIFHASAATEQPDGQHLTNPSIIQPGWTLTIPDSPTHHAAVMPPPAHPAAHPGAHTTAPQLHPRHSPAQSHTASHAAGRAHTQPGSNPAAGEHAPAHPATAPHATAQHPTHPATALYTTAHQPAAAAHGATAGVAQQTPVGDHAVANLHAGTADHHAAHPDDAEAPSPLRTEFGLGALLAAGLLGLYARNAYKRDRARKPGFATPVPEPAVRAQDEALQRSADPNAADRVNRALRTLSAGLAEAGQPLPEIRYARYNRQRLELRLAAPAELPAPFVGTIGQMVWTLEADEPILDQATAATIPAPYPSMVVIGHDPENNHILIDLEHVVALGVDGNDADTTAFLTAMALELAVSNRAEDLQVTLVGFCPELPAALGDDDRVCYLDDAEHLITVLEGHARTTQGQLEASDDPDLNTARTHTDTDFAWTPHVVLLARPIPDELRDRLDDVLNDLPRVGIAAVTGHVTDLSDWTMRLDAQDPTVAHLEPLKLLVTPQRLDTEHYQLILAGLRHSAAPADAPGPDYTRDMSTDEPALGDIASVPAADEHVIDLTDASTDAPHHQDQFAEDNPAGPIEQPVTVGTAVEVHHAQPGTPPQEIDLTDLEHTPTATSTATDYTLPSTPAAASPAADRVVAAGTARTQVRQIPRPAPIVRTFGAPDVLDAEGNPIALAPKQVELAVYLGLFETDNWRDVRDAVWNKDFLRESVNQAMSRLRNKLGADPITGDPYMPSVKDGHAIYSLGPNIRFEWTEFRKLIGTHVSTASTTNLEAALATVRERPFRGAMRTNADGRVIKYAFAIEAEAEQIRAIHDVANEVARRAMHAGDVLAADTAARTGLSVGTEAEALWRYRLLAAHALDQPAELNAIIDQLHAQVDDLGIALQPATEQLIDEIVHAKPVHAHAL